MSNKFDFPLAIKELAEAERPCFFCRGSGHTPEPLTGSGQSGPEPGAKYICSVCNGTGRIVPFASLRVACNGGDIKGPHYHHSMYYNPSTGKPCNKSWVPEPDVRVACWEIYERNPDVLVYLEIIIRKGQRPAGDAKEQLIRAAQSWLKEQYDTL